MINDRLHDQLQQLANGELDSRAEARVRAEIDRSPEAQSLFLQYSALKSDMALLQDIPPDQLSKERLRARLLGEALKPERPAPIWTWLWMPTLAGALAFVLFFNRTKSAAMPSIIGAPVSAPATTALKSESVLKPTFSSQPSQVVATQDRVTDISSVSANEEVQAGNPGPSAEQVTRTPRYARHRTRAVAAAEAAPTESSPAGVVFDAIKNAAGSTVATISPKITALSSEPKDDSVVVISNSVDADTGAQHATEETASNVLVGG